MLRTHLRSRSHTAIILAGSNPMLDLIMLVSGFVLFAASIVYVSACDRL
jgi:hypothetical protein